MKILTLDCSSKCTGWALGDGTDIKYGAIWAKGKPEDRLISMAKAIIRLVRRKNADLVYYEHYVNPGRGHSILPELIGAVKVGIHPIVMHGIYPQTWRSRLHLKKNGDWKRSAKHYVERAYKPLKRVRHNLERRLVRPTDDVYDAIAILLAVQEQLNGAS